MELVIDGRTMAVSTPSGVPVTDILLVLGDTVPVRIRVDHALADCTPALAVKETIGSADLIMTVTNWTREEDWQTASWVVNTIPLQEALGSADNITLVGEVVLVAPDGAQHTSRPIRVTVRRDILPAEYAPPAEVLINWEEMVAATLAAQLPDALHEAGMYVTPATGACSMSPPGYDQDHVVSWSWARFRLGDDMLAGYVGSVYKIRDVGVWAVIGMTDTTPRWLDIWRRSPGGDWVLAARSTQAEASSTIVDLYLWGMQAETEIVIGDEVALHVYGGTPAAPVELPLSIARQVVAVADGRGITASLDGPITDATVMPAMLLSCTYNDGVRVGGVDLATRAEVGRTKDYVATVNREASASATAAVQAAEEVRQALNVEQETSLSTPTGTANALCHWCQIAPVHIPAGWLTAIAMMCRSDARSEMTTAPRYLGVWQADESGTYRRLDSSDNAVVQTPGAVSRWQFGGGVELAAGRPVRVALLESRGGAWPGAASVIGARMTTATDGSVVSYTGGQQAYLPQMTVTCATYTPRYAAAEHVTDAVAHITAAERTAWSAKQDRIMDADGNLTVRGLIGLGGKAVIGTNQTALIMQYADKGLALDWSQPSVPNVCFMVPVGGTTGVDYSYCLTLGLAPDTIKLPSPRTTSTEYDVLNRGESDARYAPLTDVLPALYRAAALYYSRQYEWTRDNILRDFCGADAITVLPDDMPEPAALVALTDGSNLFRDSKLTRLPASWTFPALVKCDGMFRSAAVSEVTISSTAITSCSTLIYQAHRCERLNMDFANVTSLSYMAERAHLSEFRHNLGNVTNASNAFMANPMVEFNSALPKVAYATNMFNWVPLRTCRYPVDADGRSIYESGLDQAVDNEGNGLYAYLTLPQMVAGALAFSNAQLDLPSAMSIIGSLRTSAEGITGATWLLTIGIHVDHRQDAGLLAAIEAATARGWTITTQYNGTATVATISEDQPDAAGQLWCQAVEDEAGEYVDAAGVRYRVDWGHEISGPSGDAQQLGYTQHATLDAALAQWGLTSQPVDPSLLNS